MFLFFPTLPNLAVIWARLSAIERLRGRARGRHTHIFCLRLSSAYSGVFICRHYRHAPTAANFEGRHIFLYLLLKVAHKHQYFFGFIQQLYNFFSASTHRWSILQLNMKHNANTIKSLSNTRWSVRADACRALYNSWDEIINASRMALSKNVLREMNQMVFICKCKN